MWKGIRSGTPKHIYIYTNGVFKPLIFILGRIGLWYFYKKIFILIDWVSGPVGIYSCNSIIMAWRWLLSPCAPFPEWGGHPPPPPLKTPLLLEGYLPFGYLNMSRNWWIRRRPRYISKNIPGPNSTLARLKLGNIRTVEAADSPVIFT